MTAYPFISLVCSVVISLAMAASGLGKQPESSQQSRPQNDMASIMPAASGVRVPFVANEGQLGDNGVLFYARTFGGTAFVHADGDIGYTIVSRPARRDAASTAPAEKTYVLRERLFYANAAHPAGETRSPTRVSFFYGNDPANWVRGQPAWESLALGEIYDGIELSLRAHGHSVEKVFTVAPDADPDLIAVAMVGADALRIGDDGTLVATTCYGDVGFSTPVAYQEKDGERIPVTVAYRVAGTAYGFELGSYDPSLPLTIDPILASTYLGGSATENNTSYNPGYLALDTAGNVYITGTTESTNFPTTAGAYNRTNQPSWQYGDVFVSKLDSSLSTLLASTYLGGWGEDDASALALDGSGNVLVTGATESHNFPCTGGAFSTNYVGAPHAGDWGDDAFVSKLSSDLSQLLASTYLAGWGWDRGYAIKADSSGNIYVTGNTDATNFPTTPGSYQPLPASTNEGSGGDVFISKFDGQLTQLLAGTYVGGRYGDTGYALLLDSSGNIYVTGVTGSSNFPTTAGAYCRTYSPEPYQSDSFVFIMNNNLTELLASTYIGGSGDDYLHSIGRDAAGNVYVAGYTDSTNYPTTTGAYQTSKGSYDDTVVSKFNSTLSTLTASTYLGSGGFDWGEGLALDASGNVYVVGTTESSFFPTTSEEPNLRNGYKDWFVSKFDADLTTLLASARFGGNSNDGCYSVVSPAVDTVYVAGHSDSVDFPVTAGAYCTARQGAYDMIITKLHMPDHVPSPISYTPVAADLDGDRKADPTAISNGFWYVWRSSQNYEMLATSIGIFSDAWHLAADFDGDGLADPSAALTTLWFIYPSTLGYDVHEYTFGTATGTALAADFDGDGKADPARFTNGNWYVCYSGNAYTEGGPYNLGGGAGTPLAADFDGDRKADPAVVIDGNWYVWFSLWGYAMGGPYAFGTTTGSPLAADFDGDGKADPAWFICPDWYVWFSGNHYTLGGPYRFSIGSE